MLRKAQGDNTTDSFRRTEDSAPILRLHGSMTFSNCSWVSERAGQYQKEEKEAPACYLCPYTSSAQRRSPCRASLQTFADHIHILPEGTPHRVLLFAKKPKLCPGVPFFQY